MENFLSQVSSERSNPLRDISNLFHCFNDFLCYKMYENFLFRWTHYENDFFTLRTYSRVLYTKIITSERYKYIKNIRWWSLHNRFFLWNKAIYKMKKDYKKNDLYFCVIQNNSLFMYTLLNFVREWKKQKIMIIYRHNREGKDIRLISLSKSSWRNEIEHSERAKSRRISYKWNVLYILYR